MEIRRCRDGELHNARRRFQFPIIVGARIALDENATGGRVRLHVVRCALNVDIAACGARFDTPSRTGNAKDARDGAHVDIAVDFRDRHTSGRGRYAEIIDKIRCGYVTAVRGELGVALDFFDADGPRSGLNFYRTAHAANSLRTGGDGGAYFCVARDLNRIREISLPIRMVSPVCPMGGFATVSSKRFCGLSKPNPEARTSPRTCTFPSELPVMSTSPEAFVISRRIGPVTL